jgi:bilirubin oxidase
MLVGPAPGGRASAASAVETLAAPPVLVNRSSEPGTVEVDLVAEPIRYSLVPGKTHNFLAFNGRIPGPTLEFYEEDRVIVHFHNKLKEPTNVHWHGLSVPVEADGNPMDLVGAGKRYDYVFTLPKGSAGTYWYHPHPHGRAGWQVARGLFGAIIVRSREDPLAHLPEKLLVVSDVRLTSYGSVIFPTPNNDEQGWEGNTVFVNGQMQPTIALRPGEVQRWRVINASVARYYRLALPGHTFLHVGSDGGLFERAVPREEILLAPSERAELLVRGEGTPGSRIGLRSLPYDRYLPYLRPRGWDQPLDVLTVQYPEEPLATPPALPEVLRPVPPLDPAAATVTRQIVLQHALINGRRFDHHRVDAVARLGDTQIWTLENRDAMDHPFHLHGFSFQILDRNGVPEPFPAWEDTVNVPRGQTVRIIIHFAGHPGRRMFHCHIMDHEDYGMMATLEVYREGVAQRKGGEPKALGPAVSEPAPEFALRDAGGETYRLADYRGKNLVLVFYLGGDCSHCLDQLRGLGKEMPTLKEQNTAVLAISASRSAAGQERKPSFPFPVVYDADHTVAKRYQAHDTAEGLNRHATVLIDPEGRVCWSTVGSSPFTDWPFLKGEIERVARLRAEGRASGDPATATGSSRVPAKRVAGRSARLERWRLTDAARRTSALRPTVQRRPRIAKQAKARAVKREGEPPPAVQ